eukprot:gene8710-8891_t
MSDAMHKWAERVESQKRGKQRGATTGSARVQEKSRNSQEAALQQSRESRGKGSSDSSGNGSIPGPWSWPKRMGNIQALMAGMQEQLHALCGLHGSNPAVTQGLKQKGQQHLELLMQLAEAEQRHVTGELSTLELEKLLQGLLQQLDREHPALAGSNEAASTGVCNSTTKAPSNEQWSTQGASHGLKDALTQSSELLGSTEELKLAVERARAYLSIRQRELSGAAANGGAQRQQQGEEGYQSAPEQADAQEQLHSAQEALQDTQSLRMDFDRMCQHAFELSRKLSSANMANAELQSELSDVKARLVAAGDELAEHRELQMTYDQLCQDMYRLRMMLQKAQANGNDLAEQAAAAMNKHKQKLQEAKAQILQLRGQLAQTRRELQQASGRVAKAEAALQQQAAEFQARLAQLQTWYGKQAAVVAQLRKGKALEDGQIGFTNTNRFWVRQEQLFDFIKHWLAREALLQDQQGFFGLQVQPQSGAAVDGGVDVVVSSLWESIPSWEAWSKSDLARQHHMPTGVYQYVPAKGEGFPEDFVPFRDYDQAVVAKY